MLGVEGPPAKGRVQGDSYCFEKDIRTYSGNKTAPTTRFADFYKEGHFLIDAKQDSGRPRKNVRFSCVRDKL